MKIIYITTSTTNTEIELAIKNDCRRYNPSNQNFHHALIRAFACNYNVEVISSAKCFDKNKNFEIEDYINYNFLKYSNYKFLKIFSLKKSLNDLLTNIYKNDANLILVIDAMNVRLSYSALKIAKKLHLTTIGIISDHPYMLNNVSKAYQKSIINLFKKYDAYIFLTENLNKEFNLKNKPFIIINGIYSNNKANHIKIKTPYFFFSGALYEKYGVKTLINAFLQTANDYNLIIAGDGELKNYIVKKSIRVKRLQYVGVLPQNELQTYQESAIANINPRPFTKKMDAFCIPSKMFEYLASGSIVISTYHSLLYKDFKPCVLWCEDNENSLIETIDQACDLDKATRKRMIKYASNVINKKYSLNTVAKNLDAFIKKLKI